MPSIPLKHIVVFILILVGISFLYNFHNTTKKLPASKHQWRQTDAYSQAINYYKEGLPLLEPKIHLQQSIDGNAIGEFPILYYINATLWKVTGVTPISFRLIHLLITLSGLFYLFKLSYFFLKDFFLSAIIPITLFSSPLFGYYSNNFLVNLPALALLFIAAYHTLVYFSSSKNKNLLFGIFFSSIAVLLRPTLGIALIPVGFVYLFELFKNSPNSTIKNKVIFSFYFIIPTLSLAVYTLYSKHYNSVNASSYFLTTIRPIWDYNSNEISNVFEKFTQDLIPELYPIGISTIILLLIVYFIFTIKKRHFYFNLFAISYLICIVSYFLLWYNNFDVHDYYLIEFLILIPALLIPLLLELKKWNINKRYYVLARASILLLCLLSLSYSASITHLKYKNNDEFFTKLFISKTNKEYWDWYHWYYNSTFKAYESITPYLRSIGINREDLVISFHDQSSNISLVLMDQKGFTSLYFSHLSFKEKVQLYANKGAKYLMLNNNELILKEQLSEYTTNQVGTFENILIFDIRKFKK